MKPILRCLPVALLAILAACASPEDKVKGHLEKARALMAQQKFDQAKIEARNAAQIQPKNAEAHDLLAQIAWRNGNVPEAFQQYLMAVEGDPKLLDARIRLGDLYFFLRDEKGTAEQAEAAKALAPDKPEVRLLVGKSLALQGDIAGAAREIDAALAANPALVDAITSKANLLSGQEDTAGALAVIDQGLKNVKPEEAEGLRDFRLEILLAGKQDDAYEAALKELAAQYPDKAKYRYQLLDFYTERERTAEQEQVLRELVKLDKDNKLLPVRLANMLMLRQSPEAAEKLLKDEIARNPGNAQLQLGLGDFYRYNKRSKEAMAIYQQVADKYADSTAEGLEARNRIVAQYTLDGDIPQAQAGIEAILKVAPDDPNALLARSTFAFLERRYEDAIADLRNVIRRQKSPEALLLLARSYVGAGDPVVAKDTYRRLLDDYPGNAEGATELATLLSSQGEGAAATEILRKFVAQKPGDAAASASLIQNLLAQKDLSGAEAEARRLAESGQDRTAAQRQLGLVLQAKGDTEAALAGYKSILEKNPGDVAALEGLVGILVQKGQAFEAVSWLKRAPQDNVDVILLLGNVDLTQGDVAGARQYFEQAVKQHPDVARAYVALASLSPEDSPEQQAVLERAWKASPGDLAVGVYLAGIQERRGKPEEAIATYEAVLKENPSNVLVINNMVSLILDHRTDKQSLAQALELAKPLAAAGDAITLDTLGWAYYVNGDYASAVRHLERAVATDSTSAIAQYHLGKAYVAANNPVSAVQHLQKAIELGGPKSPFASDAQATLAKARKSAPGG